MVRHGDIVQTTERISEDDLMARARDEEASYIFTVEEVHTPVALSVHKSAWNALSAAALTANPSLEPFYHLPALRHLARGHSDVATALVWRNGGLFGRERLLVGLVSYRLEGKPGWLARGPVGTWDHDWSFLGAPLLHRDHAGEAMETFLDWFARHRGPRFLFRAMPASALLRPAFEAALGGRASRLIGSAERPVWRAEGDAATYMREALTSDRRNRLKRQRRRLERQGRVAVEQFAAGSDPGPWLSRFSELEAAGWKGRLGTAIASRAETRALFDDIARTAAADGRLLMWSLDLDKAPVAMVMGIVAGDTAYLMKMTYDEAFAQCSPGMLIVPSIMEWAAAAPDIDWVDSCAAADHPMWSRLWRSTHRFDDILVDCSGRRPGALDLAARAERVRRNVRARIKRVYRIVNPEK